MTGLGEEFPETLTIYIVERSKKEEARVYRFISAGKTSDGWKYFCKFKSKTNNANRGNWFNVLSKRNIVVFVIVAS